MKKALLSVLLILLLISVDYAQVKISTAYNYPPQDLVLSGLKSIRGMAYHPDPVGNGHSGIMLTNYNDQGYVHVFETVSDDSIQLVWSSPKVAANGGGSTPRYCLFGDLDNDGLLEVIYQSAGNGIFIFEWDGVPGSWNFGTQPSQLISSTIFAGVAGNAEFFEIADPDMDNVNELLISYNSSPAVNDRHYIISAVGDWSTDSPGFSGFVLEKDFSIPDLAAWGAGGQSPYTLISAQLDGTGNKEMILHNWNFMNVLPVRTTGADTYILSDTTNHKQSIQLGGLSDDVALFGGMAYDIDGDGREEVYLPVYYGDVSHKGWVHMIHYEPGQSTAEIDSTNAFLLDMSPINGSVGFGYGYGDLDGNGKKNLYFSSVYPYNVVSAEFQGGNKLDANNWVYSLVYAGQDDIYTNMTIKDSLGNADTSYVVQPAFASKIYSRDTDFDKDGFQDILLPYQAINDSIEVKTFTFNSSTQQFDSVVTKIENPKRWGFRILESLTPSGIDVKELTIITPNDFTLEQNYPNPFNPVTTIRFHLPVDKKVSLKVYDMLGEEISLLINNEEFSKGVYEVNWDGTNNAGIKVASGNYIAELKFGNFTKSIKMSLLK